MQTGERRQVTQGDVGLLFHCGFCRHTLHFISAPFIPAKPEPCCDKTGGLCQPAKVLSLRQAARLELRSPLAFGSVMMGSIGPSLPPRHVRRGKSPHGPDPNTCPLPWRAGARVSRQHHRSNLLRVPEHEVYRWRSPKERLSLTVPRGFGSVILALFNEPWVPAQYILITAAMV